MGCALARWRKKGKKKRPCKELKSACLRDGFFCYRGEMTPPNRQKGARIEKDGRRIADRCDDQIEGGLGLFCFF